MRNPKPPYPAQFRQQMIELVAAGRKPSALAKEFGCHETTISGWARQSGGTTTAAVSSATQGPTLTGAERQELNRTKAQAAPSSNGARHIGKGYGLVCRQKREDVHTVYQLVKANQAEFPTRKLCETLSVSTSGYYDWQDRPPCERAKANAVLTMRIKEAYQASDDTYGMPRIRAELADAGVLASRKRIAHLMRQSHIQGVSRRRAWCVTTERNKRERPAPDLVNRQFVATAINQLWVADMTYIPTWAGFLFLAVGTDVYSRKVVGWAFGETMTSELVINALNMALLTRKPESVIHHSDQGSQTTTLITMS